MLLRSLSIVLGLFVLPLTFCNADQGGDEFHDLFNGKDLNGWSGNEALWSVDQGTIVGQTTPEKPTAGNTFLVWQGGEVADFEFRCQVRFEGNNSGVQYRSASVSGNPHVLQGYQADLHENQDYFGMMYGERYGSRGIITLRGQKMVINADGTKQVVENLPKTEKLVDKDWNELRIIAVGNRMIHQVNGITTIDLTDNDPSARASGLLGLQLHAGPAMKVEFRKLQLRSLTPEQGADFLEKLPKTK